MYQNNQYKVAHFSARNLYPRLSFLFKCSYHTLPKMFYKYIKKVSSVSETSIGWT